jgi:hypothetical protein
MRGTWARGGIGLVQFRKRRQRGKGLAIAGLVLSVAWILVIAVIIGVATASRAHRSAAGTITRSGQVDSALATASRTLPPGRQCAPSE